MANSAGPNTAPSATSAATSTSSSGSDTKPNSTATAMVASSTARAASPMSISDRYRQRSAISPAGSFAVSETAAETAGSRPALRADPVASRMRSGYARVEMLVPSCDSACETHSSANEPRSAFGGEFGTGSGYGRSRGRRQCGSARMAGGTDSSGTSAAMLAAWESAVTC